MRRRRQLPPREERDNSATEKFLFHRLRRQSPSAQGNRPFKQEQQKSISNIQKSISNLQNSISFYCKQSFSSWQYSCSFCRRMFLKVISIEEDEYEKVSWFTDCGFTDCGRGAGDAVDDLLDALCCGYPAGGGMAYWN